MSDGGEVITEIDAAELRATQTIRDAEQTVERVVATVAWVAGGDEGEMACEFDIEGSTAILRQIDTGNGVFYAREDPQIIRTAEQGVAELPFVQAVVGLEDAVAGGSRGDEA